MPAERAQARWTVWVLFVRDTENGETIDVFATERRATDFMLERGYVRDAPMNFYTHPDGGIAYLQRREVL